MWRDAETGANDYIAVFVPWFWQEEYRKVVAPDPGSGSGAGFILTAEERDYASLYGLDDEQMAWRRGKIAELKDASLFAQEYPATAAEAFQMSGHDSFIPPALIARARKAACEKSGPLVIGYDPAWLGEDRHTMAWRRGRRVTHVESRMKLDTVEAAGWLKQVIDADQPAKVFMDVGGVGAGVYDQLKHMGPPYSDIVEAVNFGSPPFEPPPLDEQGRPSGGPLSRSTGIASITAPADASDAAERNAACALKKRSRGKPTSTAALPCTRELVHSEMLEKCVYILQALCIPQCRVRRNDVIPHRLKKLTE